MNNPVSTITTETIQAIFFDMNGTLRNRVPHEPTQQAAFSRLLQILGRDSASQSFWEELTRRQKAYSHWAQENLLQLTEEEIWTKWILPDLPPERIAPHAPELTLAWMERKGRAVPVSDAEETIKGLKQRGYLLGLISNSMSSLDIPMFLRQQAWEEYFAVVILSSFLKSRKPSPEPFLEATHRLGLDPKVCAFVGNRVARDMAGCKRAGFALGIMIEALDKRRSDERNQSGQPDLIIHSLADLMGIFS